MAIPDIASACQPDQSYTCRALYDWTGSEFLARSSDWLINKPLAILGLIVIGLLIRWIANRFIDRVVRSATDGMLPARSRLVGRKKESTPATVTPHRARRAQRAKAMGGLLKSIASGVIIVIIGVMALAEVGVNVAPIIASAGIVGLALGFGAQSLVGDFLAGMFMIFEDQYGIGDVIDAEYAIGTVEAVGLRVTRLRDVDGTVWYVRNGEIIRVGNMSQNWARTVLDIGVGYHEDLSRVKRVLIDVAHDLWVDEDFKGMIIEEPEVWGVQSLDPDQVTVRVTLKTAPMEQWGIAREMRERIKARFDYEHIEIPFPQRVVWHRDQPQPGGATDEPAAPSGE